MKAKITNLHAVGPSMYEDDRGRKYYVKRKEKTAYHIDEKDKKYFWAQNKFTMVMMLAIVVGFYFGWFYGGICALIAYLLLYVWFYERKYLPELDKYENVDIPENHFVVDNLRKRSKTNNIIMICACIAASVLLVVLMFQQYGGMSLAELIAEKNAIATIIVSIGMIAVLIVVVTTAIKVVLTQK